MTSSENVTLEDLLRDLSSGKKLKKLVSSDTKKRRAAKAPVAELAEKPIPKVLLERLERKVALQQSSKDISKWLPLVAAARKAEHLDFSVDNSASLRITSSSLVDKFIPTTDMEKAVADLVKLGGQQLPDSSEMGLPDNTSALSIEQVKERQVALQKMRSLIFYENQKRRRAAKIKSKSYHRVHRKPKLTADDSLSVRMRREMERAKERMSLRHKASQLYSMRKNADATEHSLVKADLERIRALKERIGADSEASESDDVGVSSDGEAPEEQSEDAQPTKGLMAMKFMKNARLKALPVEEEDMGESVSSSDEASKDGNDASSSDDDEDPVLNNDFILDLSHRTATSLKRSISAEEQGECAPMMNVSRSKLAFNMEALKKKMRIDESASSLSMKRALLEKVFEGDELFEKDFMGEKGQEMEADAPKVRDETLPGWGAWGGQGTEHLPKKQFLVQPKPGEGVPIEKRKDVRLKHVIISEKKIKSLSKYQHEKVPFPFKDKLQYEHAQRMPVGKEWNTQQTFQKQILPRVITKQGQIIRPLKASKKGR